MTQPARFLFDRDFAGGAAVRPPPPEPPVPADVHRAAVAAADLTAYSRGLAAGREAAEAKAAGRLADEAKRLANAAQAILAGLDTERERIERDATALAAAIGDKLAGQLIARHPREAVLAVIAECLEPLRAAPHLVVRLAEADEGPLGKALGKIASDMGFAGRLVVLADKKLPRGDCRVEWAEGGIVLDHGATARAVADAVARHLGAAPAEEA